MQGDLKQISLPDLIQTFCEGQKTAAINLKNDRSKAKIFINKGNIVHATLDNLVGEQAFFEMLTWDNGEFLSELDQETNTKSIEKSWQSILLEGVQQKDESQTTNNEKTSETKTTSKKPMKKKGEILNETLQALLQQSTDIHGAAIVGNDGLVYSANVPEKDLDENMVGAAAAAILGLSRRSAEQLNRGGFTQTLIQGTDGNIIVCDINEDILLVGLTAKAVNLGMAFAELRDFVQKLKDLV